MLNIVLVEPEIPMNTGNIARTCAATGSALHLVRPLGFDISDKAVKRAGLDYWSLVDLHVYESLDDFFARHPDPDLWLTTTKAPRSYQEARFTADSWLFFGKETAGLPLALRERYRDRCVRLPMVSPQPQSGQPRGRRDLRGPAPAGLSRPGRRRPRRLGPAEVRPDPALKPPCFPIAFTIHCSPPYHPSLKGASP